MDAFRSYRHLRNLIEGNMRNQVFNKIFCGVVEMNEALFIHRVGPERRGKDNFGSLR